MGKSIRLGIAFVLLGSSFGCASLRARMLAQQAVDLYHKQDYAGAAAKFAEAEKYDATIPAIELNLGYANLALYRSSPNSTEGKDAATRAIAAFERYLTLRPNEEKARLYLIQTFVDTGHYDDAVAFFKPAVDKEPPDPEALNTLGIIASKTGRFEDAKKWYEKRIQVQPDSVDAHLALGVLIWTWLHDHQEETGPKRMELASAAIETLGKAIKLA